jgi:hypothetical protein
MIYKRFSTKGSNPHIKLWNNELERLFDFKSLPKNTTAKEDSPDIMKDGKKVQTVDDLDGGHLNDLMNQKILLPISKIVEEGKDACTYKNPILERKPISIETALIYGESDRFYRIIDHNKQLNE